MPYKDPQKLKEYQREYRLKNKERIAKQKKEKYSKEERREKYLENKVKFQEYYLDNRECILEKHREYRDKNREQINLKRGEFLRENKIKLKELLGGKCVVCGTTENLQFDHIDYKTKLYKISGIAHLQFDNEKLQTEIKKCQLLCEKCHLEKTLKERKERNY